MSHWSNLFHSQHHSTALKHTHTHTKMPQTHFLTALSQPQKDISGIEKVWFTVGGAKLCLKTAIQCFLFFFSFSWHWIVSFSRWLKTQSPSGCWISFFTRAETFEKVSTGVFKWCVWVLHMRPVNFTLLSFRLTKKKNCNKNRLRDGPSQSNVPLGHPYWLFFYSCA